MDELLIDNELLDMELFSGYLNCKVDIYKTVYSDILNLGYSCVSEMDLQSRIICLHYSTDSMYRKTYKS